MHNTTSTITIKSHADGQILFNGPYPTIRHALEAAVAANTSLRHADLRGANLTHANLDGADMRHACCDGADFTGANLSEADFTAASARMCDFTMACLAESRLIGVDFSASSFNATLLTGAVMEACVFSCPTAFTLPFTALKSMGTSIYRHDARSQVCFSAPPIIVTGLPERLVFLDDAALIGNRLRPHAPGTALVLNEFLRRNA